MADTSFKFAGIQMKVGTDKEKNLENARKNIEIAAKNGAKVVSLPVRPLFVVIC
jgi:predicted amidohydrolase